MSGNTEQKAELTIPPRPALLPFRVDLVDRRKAPRAVDEDAQPHAITRRTRDVLDLAFARGDRFAAVAINPDVGVRRAKRGGPGERRVRGFGARRVAGGAELAYAQLTAEMHPPRGVIDVLVTDDFDFSNGSAITYPTNTPIANPRRAS